MIAFMSERRSRQSWGNWVPPVRDREMSEGEREVCAEDAVAEAKRIVRSVAAGFPVKHAALGDVWIATPVEGNAHAALVEALERFLA